MDQGNFRPPSDNWLADLVRDIAAGIGAAAVHAWRGATWCKRGVEKWLWNQLR